MNIRDTLLAEYSRRQMLKIVGYIDGDPVRFAELMKLFLGDTYRVSQRAAWVVNYCAETHPALITPYFSKLIRQLERDDSHVAVKRNVVRLFQLIEIPRRYRGRVFEACYNLVDDAKEPVAVKVFAMTVAAQIANDKPGLLRELRLVVDKYLPHASAGFRARARKVFAAA